MRATLDNFFGERPLADPSKLQPGEAVRARNCKLRNGNLAAYRKTQKVADSALTKDAKTLYLWAPELDDPDAGYFFEWDQRVSVAPAALVDDDRDTTIYTGDGYPKITDSTLATIGGAGAYPRNAYRLGIPAPTTAPTIAAQTPSGLITGATQANPVVITAANHGLETGDQVRVTGVSGMGELNNHEFFVTVTDTNHFALTDLDGRTFSPYTSGGTWTQTWPGDQIQRVGYVITFVSQWADAEMEGPPSPVSNLISQGTGQPVALSGIEQPPTGNYHITTIRVYRGESTDLGAAFLYVTDLPAGTATFTDTIPDDELGDALPSANYDMPPEDMHSVISVANNMMAGARGRELCLCEPGIPHAWPVPYRRTVKEDIVALGAFGSTIVAATEGNPYVFQGTTPAALSDAEINVGQACVSARGLVSIGNSGVAFPSPDGLVAITPSGYRLATEGYFTPQQWRALNPESFHAYAWQGRYVCFYDNGDERAGFIFDPMSEIAGFTRLDWYATAGFVDRLRGRLLLEIGGEIHAFDAGEVLEPFDWKSREIVYGRPVRLSGVRVTAHDYDDLTLQVYGDDTVRASVAVKNDRPFRLGWSGRPARRIAFRFTGTSEVVRLEAGETLSELRTTL